MVIVISLFSKHILDDKKINNYTYILCLRFKCQEEVYIL